MKRILLTGASGFIGRHVRRALYESEYEIVSLIRAPNTELVPYPTEQFLIGTLAEPIVLEQGLSDLSIDACVHLAWEGIPDYSCEPSMRNLEYGFHMLRLCKNLEIKKLVITGSCWEYLSPSGKISENAPLSYENPFKTAKNALHRIATEFCRENSIALHWLRLFYVYGEGQRTGSLIPYIVKELQNGSQPVLNGAFNRNDFIHAADVAQAVCKSLDYMRTEISCETFNIGSGKASQVLDIACDTAWLLHMDFAPEKYQPPVVQPSAFWADINAAKEKLHWKPHVTLKEGIKRYIQESSKTRY